MKNDLTCAVVRDLLPSYVEGLTAEETAGAVERHLGSCPDCAARLEAMRTPPAPAGAEAVETAKEVDYLKQVKRRSRRRVAAAALATAACLLAVFLVKIFIIGTPLQAQSVAVTEREIEDGVLRLTVSSPDSGRALHGWGVETVDGVASIYARDVLVSPLYHDGAGFLNIDLEDVREVWLGGISGELVYQEGVVVSREALRRYEARTPYVGDAPALGGVARAVGLDSQRWSYTTELSTSQRPYRWTINFQDFWGDTSADTWMRGLYGPLMLALVDNLDEVGWTYTTAGSGGKTYVENMLTLEAADGYLQDLLEKSDLDQRWKSLESVKDFTATPAGTQVLYDLLWENLGSAFSPRAWIEDVPSEPAPGGAEFLEQE